MEKEKQRQSWREAQSKEEGDWAREKNGVRRYKNLAREKKARTTGVKAKIKKVRERKAEALLSFDLNTQP